MILSLDLEIDRDPSANDRGFARSRLLPETPAMGGEDMGEHCQGRAWRSD
jgi:hypothetical protein